MGMTARAISNFAADLAIDRGDLTTLEIGSLRFTNVLELKNFSNGTT